MPRPVAAHSVVAFAAVIITAVVISAALPSTATSAQTKGKAGDTTANYYVATNGNDSWSGTLATPNSGGTDGPFATIDRAREALRAIKGTEARVVLLREGVYCQEKPLVFDPKDSGHKDSPATFRAYPDEKVVISGGRRIKWERAARSEWDADLSDVKDGKWMFRQLFVGGERRFRPRLPESGHYRVGAEHPPTDDVAGRGDNRYGYASGQMSGSWRNLDQIEVIVFPRLGASWHYIKEVDDKERTVTLTGATASSEGWGLILQGSRIVLDNVTHAYDDDGEWHLDRTTGRLRYRPLDNERSAEAHAYAPYLETIVEMRGDAAKKKYVDAVRFDGITFAHTTYPLDKEGRASTLADSDLPAAVVATAIRNCSFLNCTFEHVGGYALEIGNASKDNVIEACTFRDLGAGGIKLGGQKAKAGAPRKPKKKAHKLVCSNNTIENCLIAHGGRVHPMGVGIWIGPSALNKILHNEICDFPGGGISIGRKKGYLPTHAYRNEIAHNHIHSIGLGVLSEAAAIRCIGMTIGTEIHHNHIENVRSQESGGWGVHLEEGSSNVAIHTNLIHNTTDGCVHLREGKENQVINNILANSTKHQLQMTVDEPHMSWSIERNIIVWGGGSSLLAGNWSGQNFKLDRNLYWSPGDKGVTFGGASLEQWQKTKFQDKKSIIADPKFADVDEGDYTPKNKAALKRIGFKKFDLDEFGRPGATKAEAAWDAVWPTGAL